MDCYLPNLTLHPICNDDALNGICQYITNNLAVNAGDVGVGFKPATGGYGAGTTGGLPLRENRE